MLPALGACFYWILTLSNLYRLLVRNAQRFSGEQYFAYEVVQTWLNPIVRLPHNAFPVIETWFLERILSGGLDSPERFFLYAVWEIAVLDLVFGAVAWFLALALVFRWVRKVLAPS